MSKRSGFVIRKDLTKNSKEAAKKRTLCFDTTDGEVLITPSSGGVELGDASKHDKPRYVGGFAPARGVGR